VAKRSRRSMVVDYDDYEEREYYDGDPPKAGIYEFKLVDADLEYVSKDGADGFKWTFQCTEEPYAGWFGYMYSNLDSTKQKTQRILKAIRSGSTKKIDLGKYIDNEAALIKLAKPVLGRVKSEFYQDEYSPKLAFVMELDESTRRKRKARQEVEDDTDEDEDEGFVEEAEEEYEDESDQEMDDDEDQDSDEEDSDSDEDEEDNETEGSSREEREAELQGLSLKELKEIAVGDYDLDVDGRKKKGVIEVILDHEFSDNEDDDDEVEDEPPPPPARKKASKTPAKKATKRRKF